MKIIKGLRDEHSLLAVNLLTVLMVVAVIGTGHWLGLIPLSLVLVWSSVHFGRKSKMVAELRGLNHVLENALEGITRINPRGYFTFVNKAFASALGYEVSALVGMHWTVSVMRRDQATVGEAWAELGSASKGEREVLARRKDGTALQMRFLLVQCDEERGALYCFAKDITKQRETEETLRAAQERFALAARATNDLIWDWNLTTNKALLSEAYETTYGYSAADKEVDVGQWLDAIHPDDLERVHQSVSSVIGLGGRYWSDEYRFRRADGTYANVLDRGYLIRDDAGRPVRMIGAMMDITARKQAEESLKRERRRTELILNCAGDGMFGSDETGKTAFVNKAAADMLGFTVEEMMGRSLHTTIHHSHPDGTSYASEDCPCGKAAIDGLASTVSDELFWRKDGSAFPVEYSANPMRDDDGALFGAVVSFRDISERKAVERMKDEFVSIVSHELRTPLTSIRGAIGLLAAGRLGEMPEKARRMLDIAVSNTDRLVRLINDILDIERMESGKATLNRKLACASQLMTQAIDMIQPIADKAGVQLALEPIESALWADSDRVVQTMTNLLSNAVKFAPAGSTVTLRGSIEDSNVLFEVADEGRGIPASKLDVIFERFQQVDASDSREKGGSGLGLAICRSIVRHHGGEIWAESGVGQGSTFRFTIPRVQVPRLETTQEVSRTVLVCDDDAEMRDVMVSLLEARGLRVLGVGSGPELLVAAADIEPDVILLDIVMPGMNGWHTLAALKGNERTAGVPVVIVSILPPEKYEDVAGWVQKPLDEATLFETIERAFRNADRRARVMLVEDDVDLSRVIAASFERHGIDTFHAATGAEAIEMAQRIEPDLLVLDLALPGVDGFGVVDWLKDHDRLAHVPLIVYSASEPSPSQRERLTLGPTEFLTKSRVSPEDFERRVVELLDRIAGGREELHHVA